MTNRSVIDSVHFHASVVAANEEEYTDDFTVHGIYFGEGDPENGGQHWNFTRTLGDDDDGVCTVKEIQQLPVYEGITRFEMSRTGLACVFDLQTAQKTGVACLTIAYQIDDVCWAGLCTQAKLVFTGKDYFTLTPV